MRPLVVSARAYSPNQVRLLHIFGNTCCRLEGVGWGELFRFAAPSSPLEREPLQLLRELDRALDGGVVLVQFAAVLSFGEWAALSPWRVYDV
jgi:hypothetical protein